MRIKNGFIKIIVIGVDQLIYLESSSNHGENINHFRLRPKFYFIPNSRPLTDEKYLFTTKPNHVR